MKLIVSDTEIPLDPKDVLIARSAVNAFIETTRTGADRAGSNSLYFTTLLMMYKKSNEMLMELGIDNLRYLMDLLNNGREDI